MPRGPLKALLAILLIGTVTVGCSSGDDAALSSPPSRARVTAPAAGETTTSSVPAAPTTAAGLEPCAASGLALERGEGRSALGRGLYVFELRNTSSRPCRMLGYPEVTIVDPQGRVLAEAQTTGARLLADRAPTPVVVAPGASAFVGLESANVCTEGARPAASRTVRLSPPGARDGPLTVDVVVTVCPGQAVLVSPVRVAEPDLTR